MENTFYKVFVGGPTVPECSSLVEYYADQGVSPRSFGYVTEVLTRFVKFRSGVC